MSTLFTLSPRRIAANQQNAQHSTGPKTAEGKARSAQNASSHGLFSPRLLQKGESEPEFLAYRDALLHTLCPQNPLELAQADRIISLHWRLDRIQEAECHLNQMQNLLYHQRLQARQEQENDHRQRARATLKQHDIPCTDQDLKEADLLDDPTPDSDPTPAPTPGFLIAQSLYDSHEDNHHTTPHERLLNIEQKLQSLLTRANKEYRQTRQDRQKQEQENPGQSPQCLYLSHTDDGDNEEEAPNPDPTPETTDNEPPATDTPRNSAQQGATSSTPFQKNEATCQNDTLSPVAQAAASAARDIIDQSDKGA